MAKKKVLKKVHLMKVMKRLLEVYEPASALKWLSGINAFLGDRTPLFLLEKGEYQEVLRAIDQTKSSSYS